MIYLLYTLHVLLSIFLILVVLLQQGKGADLSVFGGGSTMAAFGARSATNLLHRLTVAGFVGFIVTTLLIAYAQGRAEGGSVMEGIPSAATAAPATPVGTEAPAPDAAAPAVQNETAPVAEEETAPAAQPTAPPPSTP